jgi:hypothetical protein
MQMRDLKARILPRDTLTYTLTSKYQCETWRHENFHVSSSWCLFYGCICIVCSVCCIHTPVSIHVKKKHSFLPKLSICLPQFRHVCAHTAYECAFYFHVSIQSVDNVRHCVMKLFCAEVQYQQVCLPAKKTNIYILIYTSTSEYTHSLIHTPHLTHTHQHIQ